MSTFIRARFSGPGEVKMALHQNLRVNNGILPRRRGDMEVTRRGFVKFDINQGVNIEFDKTGCIWRKTGDLIIFSGLPITTASKLRRRTSEASVSGASVCESLCWAVYSVSSVPQWLIGRRFRSHTKRLRHVRQHNQLGDNN